MAIRPALIALSFLFANNIFCQCFNQKPFDLGNNAMKTVDERSISEYTASFIGCTMPAFTAYATDDSKITESSLRGRVTMFYFWALHDGFSVLEIPNLNKVVDAFRNQNVNFIAICRDDSAKWDKRAEKFFHFRHILRSKNLIGKFDCRPVAIIFDKNGKAVSLDFAWISPDGKSVNDRSNDFVAAIRKAMKE